MARGFEACERECSGEQYSCRSASALLRTDPRVIARSDAPGFWLGGPERQDQPVSITEPNVRQIVLELVPRFHATSESRREIILQVVRSSLSDPEPGTHMAAANARSRLGDRDAARELQGAIDAEVDEGVRRVMQDCARELRRRKVEKN